MAVSRQQAASVVDVVMNELHGRGGFDHWWGDIEEGIQEEILRDLTDQMMKKLDIVCGPYGYQG